MTHDDHDTIAAPVAAPAPLPCPPETPIPLIYLTDAELVEAITDMRCLIAEAGKRYRTSEADIDFITRIALADPEAALRCLLATARTEGIH